MFRLHWVSHVSRMLDEQWPLCGALRLSLSIAGLSGRIHRPVVHIRPGLTKNHVMKSPGALPRTLRPMTICGLTQANRRAGSPFRLQPKLEETFQRDYLSTFP